jgi:hypothetical protein
MLLLVADENFNNGLIRGILRRKPAIDISSAFRILISPELQRHYPLVCHLVRSPHSAGAIPQVPSDAVQRQALIG